jgi:succinate dehydrogenase/fumarate reductase flavoprotein subunit
MLTMTYISTVKLDTDIMIIGSGGAGSMATIEAKKFDPSIECVVMEKTHKEEFIIPATNEKWEQP